MSAILPMAMLLDMIIAHTASSFYILYNISIASATEVSETNDYWQLAWLTLSLSNVLWLADFALLNKSLFCTI